MPGRDARADHLETDVPARESTGAADDLLVRAAQHDPRRFGDLYERYADRLYRYALGRTGMPEEADDIVSETMLSALESLHRFDPERGTFAAWLFTIAGRRIADRGRARHRLVKFLRGRSGADTDSDPALDAALRDEEGLRVRTAIARLSDSHREVVLLRYVAELPVAEIATSLGISEGAVKMRLQRALRNLAGELEGDHNDV